MLWFVSLDTDRVMSVILHSNGNQSETAVLSKDRLSHVFKEHMLEPKKDPISGGARFLS